MGIALTEDHIELEKVVRSFVEDRKVRVETRALLDAPDENLPPFWQELAGLGWLGLHIDEKHGGSGYGLPELVVVAEELGRAVAPGPFIPTVIASAIIAKSGTDEQKARLLPGLIDGTTTAAVSIGGDVNVADGIASGEAGIALGLGLADLLVLFAGTNVLVLEKDRAGVTTDIPANLDPTRRSGTVALDGVAVTDADVLTGARDIALAIVRTVVAAEAVGGAQDATETAVAYAKVREQFGRTIGTFQAIKHHLANMFVAAEAALANVWDAARAASEDDEQFKLIAAAAAALALPAYVQDAELEIQVHGGIGYTWEHDAHLHLRRAVSLQALFGGNAPGSDVFAAAAKGVQRANSLDLPPEAEEFRTEIASTVAGFAGLDEKALRQKLIETGYVMPHWPKPWGLGADAVQQLVIEQEFGKASIKKPEYSITGWNILTLIQHGTQDQIDRFVLKALRGDEMWCQLFSEPGAGSDAAAVKTRAVRVDGGWKINGQKVWTSGAHLCARGLATVRTDIEAPKHKGITVVIIDMKAPGVEVRPLKQITGGSEFNEVFFSDVFVPDADVVGEPNSGWTVARATLGNERVSMGGGVAGSEGAAAYMVKLVERHSDRVAGAASRVGNFLADDEALRLLNLRRAARSIAGGAPGPEGNVTKLLLAQNMNDRAALSAELLGPAVALKAGSAQTAGMMVLAARSISIAGGTSEITRNQIAERILGLPRDPLIK